MIRLLRLLAFEAAVATAQHAPEDILKSFQLADSELRVDLVAAEPLVESPCAVAFDERGQMFVAENRGYPNTTEPPQGRIALLIDADRDGRMDQRSTFADGLTYPNGVLAWRGGVIVTCAPDILFLKDNDGDGRADERRVWFTGFDTKGSTQLRVNCPTLGPDGWIYLAAGLAGGSITSPEHSERPALRMTGDVRFNPRTLEIENVDGRSQFGLSFDEMGRRFICMNRLPVQHVVLSSRFLNRNPYLTWSDTVQDCSERSVHSGLRGGGEGVRLFPISRNITTADSHAGSFSAACGIHLWHGESLSPAYRDRAFVCDPTANLIHVDRLEPRGATFQAQPVFEGREFLASSNDWFRPVFLSGSPDGGLIIVDMAREIIEHPDYLPEEIRKRTPFASGRDCGRIWRVRHPEKKPAVTPVDFSKSDTAALVAHMSDSNGWVKATATRLLWERQSPATAKALREALDNRTSSGVSYLQLRMLDRMASPSDGQVAAFLQSQDAGVRRAAFEIAHGHVPAAAKAREAALGVKTPAGDDSLPRTLLLGEIDDPRVLDEMADSLSINPDRWTAAAVLSGIAGRELPFWRALQKRPSPAHATIRLELARLLARTTSIAKLGELALRIGKEEDDAFLVSFLQEARKRDPGVTLDLVDPDDSRLAAASQKLMDKNGRGDAPGTIELLALGEYQKVAGALALAVFAPEASSQVAAIRALAQFSDARACEVLLRAGQWQKYTPVQRDIVLDSLLANPAQRPGLLEAVESGRLPAGAISAARRVTLTKSKDAAISERALKLFTEPAGNRQQAFEQAKGVLTLPANAADGRVVFNQNCSSCHRLEREGFSLGPDLFDIRNQTKESILFHIIVPDAEIAPAFTAYAVETKDGRGLAGLVISETETSVTLRMPLGQEEAVLRSNLNRVEALPHSLMPSGLEATMTPQNLADLLAYLRGEK